MESNWRAAFHRHRTTGSVLVFTSVTPLNPLLGICAVAHVSPGSKVTLTVGDDETK